MSSRLYFRQLLAGRDYAVGDPVARQMLNFAYLVGDRETGHAVLVDPAYRPLEMVEIARNDGLEVVGALATHYHFDHVGGSMRDFAEVAGISELLEEVDIPIHVQQPEVEWIEKTTGVAKEALVGHSSGDVLQVGEIPITMIHTPGHTPGSQCLLFEGNLLSGDTLFLEGCGRTDLPGSDPNEMYTTLSERLAPIPDDTMLFPGHLYAPQGSAPMSEVREYNYILAPSTRDQWLMSYGR
jgi:glyoxylase-like metal-dependent hydrolase (beta-lactamase superfamily II)